MSMPNLWSTNQNIPVFYNLQSGEFHAIGTKPMKREVLKVPGKPFPDWSVTSITPAKLMNMILPVPQKVVEKTTEIKVPTMPVLAGFEKTIKDEMQTLVTSLKGLAQPTIYTETPQGVKEFNWKSLIPIGALAGLAIFGG